MGSKNLKEILTRTQFELARLVAAGLTNGEIAVRTGCSVRWIKFEISQRIFDRAGCSRRIELAVRYALEEERGEYARTPDRPWRHQARHGHSRLEEYLRQHHGCTESVGSNARLR